MFKSRDFALIIPAVTVELRLKGFPTAKTHSPTLAASESPKAIKDNGFSASILITAISVAGSVPIRVAEYDLLSFKVTSISEWSSNT